LIKKIDSLDGWQEMSWVRKLRSFGAVFAIAPTASIAQEYTITVHPERKYSVDGRVKISPGRHRRLGKTNSPMHRRHARAEVLAIYLRVTL
jgi:hypothetical protein